MSRRRSIILALLAALTAVGCEEAAPTADRTLTVLEYDVDGMVCGNCEQAIRTAVGGLPGVISCEASHEQGTVVVTVDDPSLGDSVLAAITDLQFSAERRPEDG